METKEMPKKAKILKALIGFTASLTTGFVVSNLVRANLDVENAGKIQKAVIGVGTYFLSNAIATEVGCRVEDQFEEMYTAFAEGVDLALHDIKNG